MAVVKVLLSIIYVVLGIAISVVILMQEGKSNGLGSAIGGMADSYWSKNKGSSKQEILKKITAVLTVLFFVLALLLDSKLFN